MAKALDSFTEFDEAPLVDDFDNYVGPKHPRLDVEYLTRRTQMFRRMTQGKDKPMTYGAQKKEKRV